MFTKVGNWFYLKNILVPQVHSELSQTKKTVSEYNSEYLGCFESSLASYQSLLYAQLSRNI